MQGLLCGVATDAPQLHRIPNPAAQFAMGEDIVSTGYEIAESVWRSRLQSGAA